MTNKQDKILAGICVILLIFSIAFFSVIKSTEVIEEPVTEALSVTREYTAGIATNMNADTLYGLLNDNDTTNDPYILSIRSLDHYVLGHIPGAVNIPLKELFSEENLAKLPTDRQIVVYCYTGHTASQATALLNVNGYTAVCLTWGMCSWTTDTTVTVGKCYDQATAAHDYPVSSGTEPGSIGTIIGNIILPQITSLIPLGCGGDTEPTNDTSEPVVVSGSGSLCETTYSSLNQGKAAIIKANDLYDNLYDGDTSNDPFLLSVRKAEHYEVGHIPGAVNIGLANLFTDENLAMLPNDDQQIVVVCYTGHTASQATALLNLNGYNATALMWGMCSWTTDADVTAGKCFNMTAHSHEYAFSTGIWDEEVRGTVYDSLNPMKTVAITADSLYDNLWDGDTSNDPFILSIRKSDAYELGHIPGAVNYGGIGGLFTDENLAKLSYNNQIVVVCYTGHTASQAAALLNLLGFNATALKWGMVGWCANTTIAPMGFTRTTPNYPIITGSEPGTIDEAEEATI